MAISDGLGSHITVTRKNKFLSTVRINPSLSVDSKGKAESRTGQEILIQPYSLIVALKLSLALHTWTLYFCSYD